MRIFRFIPVILGLLLLSCNNELVKSSELLPEKVIDPQISAVEIDSFKGSIYGKTFTVELFANSLIDIKSVRKDQINFLTNNKSVKISPLGPYNFTDAPNNTIPLSAELNGITVTYYLQITKRKIDYSTWIMIWNGSSEGWWKPDSYNGVQSLINQKWQSVNWQSDEQTIEMVSNLKSAGINVIICDLTNVWPKFHNRFNLILKLCDQNGMKACIAENTPNGDVIAFESKAKNIYDNFANPNAPYSSAYFKMNGKPLIVSYIPRLYYLRYLNSTGEYRSKFEVVNAGGENETFPDRWGWQYEFANGLIPSDNAMFVSPSAKYYPKIDGVWTCWRKHLAYLDHNFTLAKSKSPKNIIVSSYDDVHERNGWMVMKTGNADDRGMQTRNIYGEVDSVVYYNRVSEWINGTPSSNAGGNIEDGAYRIGTSDDKQIEVKDQIGSLGQKLCLTAKANTRKCLFYFYHLGNNEYRIVSLMAGLSIEPGSDNVLSQQWDNTSANQRWILQKLQNGRYRLKNKSSLKYMGIKDWDGKDNLVQQETFENITDQEWILESGLTLSGKGFIAHN